MKAIRYTKTGLKDFKVRVKVRGKWKDAKLSKNGKSYSVPKGATRVRTYFKTKGRALLLEEKAHKRGKAGYVGRKAAMRKINKRKPTKPPKGPGLSDVESILDYLTRILGPSWGLSSGMLPTSQWVSKARFFTDESELRRVWLYVRIWFAIKSDGMSDGSALPAGAQAWKVDYMPVPLPSPGAVLSQELLDRWQSIVESKLYNASPIRDEQGWVNRHNAQPRFKKWDSTAIYLGVEGDFLGTAKAQAKAKRFRARK